MSSPSRRFLIVLLAVYVAKQIVTVLVFPPFTGHDEVAHYQYVRVLATEGRVPTLYSDTLPLDLYRYSRYAISWDGQEGAALYTAVHPPMYYFLVAPAYRAARNLSPEAIQYVLRGAAIPFGVVTVILSYMLARAVFPRDSFLAVTVPSAVAFQPQISYEAAMVNNDIVAVALFSLLLYLLVVTLRDGVSMRRAVVVGCVAGCALLAKATTILALPLIAAAFLMTWRTSSWSLVLRAGACAALAVAVIAGPWWWFMVRTYGDPTAFSVLSAMQPGLTHDEPFLHLLFSGAFAVERWSETWGEFGWKFVKIDAALSVTLAAVAVAALLGLCTYAAAERTRGRELQPWQAQALWLLGAACILSYFAVVQFGTRFVLTQARYYFPAVAAAALLLMLGLRAWIPPAWHPFAQGAVVFAQIALTITIYTAHVIPYWHF